MMALFLLQLVFCAIINVGELKCFLKPLEHDPNNF